MRIAVNLFLQKLCASEKKLLEERSDATIVTPGGIGTYEEFFEILTLKSLQRLDRPIVLYNINGYYDRMKALLQHTADEKFMDVANMELCAFMDDPEQILTYIENYRRQWTQTKE